MADPLRPSTQVSVIGSAVLGAALAVAGARALFSGGLTLLFALVLLLIGIIAIALSVQAWRRQRAAWAYLVAMWGILGFCAFFAAPKVIALPKLKQVTPDLEMKLGREKAEARVDDENLKIRLQNIGVCVLFAAPFVALCAGLATRGREFERRG